MIELQITSQGGIQMLHDDAVDLEELGDAKIIRASNVEFSDGNPPSVWGMNRWPKTRGWFVQSVKTGIFLAEGFKTRTEALVWEKAWYSPSGPGWKELTEEGN